ncbi:MAG: response regulator [Verrucomicrobiota bacterium]
MESSQRRVLLVDDDPRLLAVLQPLLTDYSGGRWEARTAVDASTALAILQEGLIDLVVIDVHMPLVDGIQFLRLVHRRFPGLAKVVLTGDATGAHRQVCLNSGADLYLEKPRLAAGWQSIFATLDQLARLKGADSGFRGVLRRVELQDVLQMECLARSSSVFDITDGSLSGRIYIQDGNFIHAQAGDKLGVEALNALLALKHGEFSLHPFAEPSARTVEGQWEFLLMEAARQRDEASGTPEPDASLPSEELVLTDRQAETLPLPQESPSLASPASKPEKPRIDEVLLCSARGDIWHEWQVKRPEARIQMLTLLRHKAGQLSEGLSLGQADHLEIGTDSGRVVIQFRPDCSLFLRSSRVPISEAVLA